MNYFLAILPILSVLLLMLVFRMGGQQAGPTGWFIGLCVGILAFGLNWNIFWVSQVKGLLLSLNVLAALWTALFLYNLVDQIGGVKAIAKALEASIADRGLLLLILAWAFSGIIEGLSGFGLPMAIVSPMLIALGVSPLLAVAASATGHAWAVSLGNMGVVYQTLTSVAQMDPAALAPATAFLLGITCLACGLGTAIFLGQIRRWPVVVLLALLMSSIQYAMAAVGMVSLASFLAAASGVLGGILISRIRSKPLPAENRSPVLTSALLAYGLVVFLLMITTLVPPLHNSLSQVIWKINFPAVVSYLGVVTPAGPGQIFRPLLHPGTIILVGVLIGYQYFRYKGYCQKRLWQSALTATWQSARPASIGVISMVGLSTLMDHTGMTLLLAQGLSTLMGSAFPIVSPLVGMLGAFATGSNNNSNVLFAPMQKNAAVLLGIKPAFMVASQTTGGSIGSMIAPAKISVGCSTNDMKGREGEVLRYTLPAGILIGFIIGLTVWLMVQFSG